MAALEIATIDEKLIEEVKHHVEQEDRPALTKLVDDMRPADMADLIEHLDPGERLFIFKLLEPEGAGDVLVEIEAPVQLPCFGAILLICFKDVLKQAETGSI